MAEGVEFLLALKNQISGPAGQAKASLGSLKTQLKGVETEMKELNRLNAIYKLSGDAFKDQIKKNQGELAQLKIAHTDLKDAVKEATPPSESFTAKLAKGFTVAKLAEMGLETLKKAFDAVKDAVIGATEKLVEWTIEGAKIAIDAGAFKEQATAQYALFAKSAADGKRIFEQVDALGAALHVPTQKAHDYAKDLIAEGIKGPNRLEQAVKSLITLSKVGGDAAANKLKGILEETAKTEQTQRWKGGRGTFTVTREQLVGTGVTIDEVYGSLAKRLKKSTSEVRLLMMQGRVTAAQGIDALNDVIERGKIGETARNMTGDLSQAFTEVKDNFAKIMRDVDYKGFIKEISGFARMLDPATASGKTLKSVLVPAFNAIFDAGRKLVRGLKIGFLELEIAGLRLLIFLGPQIKQFKKLWGEMQKSQTVSIVLKAAWLGLKGVFVSVALAIKGTIVIINSIMMAIKGLDRVINAISNPGQELVKKWDLVGVGKRLLADLVAGLKQGADAVKGTFDAIGKGSVDALKKAWGISSPSKEAMKMREQIDAGFEKGGTGGLVAKQQLKVDAGGGGGGALTVNVPLTVQGGPQRMAEQLRDDIEQFIDDWLEKKALQFGGQRA